MVHTIKKVFKIIIRVIGIFILFVAVYLLSAYCLSRLSVEREKAEEGNILIYLLSNGVHTDIVVPVKTIETDWSRKIKYENTRANDTLAGWVAFGWGDKGFYLETPTWADLKFSTAFKAAFSLSTAAIHSTFYRKLEEGENCKSIKLNKSQYVRLIKYINESLITNDKGEVLNIKTNANYGKNDAFYEARGSYNLFHTCNTWTNNALKACGQKACWWTPFDKGILYQYRKDK